jgi:8-hydroxy-5-deazaflavin:NADPH oxidoreductase
VEWAKQAHDGRHGTCADAARISEIVINCTAGTASLDAVQEAGSEHFAGKILIDVANRLERTETGPTVLTTDTSLGEDLQHALPHTRAVEALTTVNHQLMVNPSPLPEPHHISSPGSGVPGARPAHRIRLGPDLITAARTTELYMALWIRLWGVASTPHFNIRLVTSAG